MDRSEGCGEQQRAPQASLHTTRAGRLQDPPLPAAAARPLRAALTGERWRVPAPRPAATNVPSGLWLPLPLASSAHTPELGYLRRAQLTLTSRRVTAQALGPREAGRVGARTCPGAALCARLQRLFRVCLGPPSAVSASPSLGLPLLVPNLLLSPHPSPAGPRPWPFSAHKGTLRDLQQPPLVHNLPHFFLILVLCRSAGQLLFEHPSLRARGI